MVINCILYRDFLIRTVLQAFSIPTKIQEVLFSTQSSYEPITNNLLSSESYVGISKNKGIGAFFKTLCGNRLLHLLVQGAHLQQLCFHTLINSLFAFQIQHQDFLKLTFVFYEHLYFVVL
jgi:hypothetical protein